MNGPELRDELFMIFGEPPQPRMADLKVSPHVIETVLNHISGHRAGVAGIYNRSTYVDEVRAALKRWASHVEKLVA
jgi:hypothetical protein